MIEISKIIERELSYWIAKNHNYKQFFDKLKVEKCILAIRFDLNNNPLKEKIITDFIKGAAIIRHALIKKTEEYDAEIDRLMRPLFELMEQRRATPDYQDQIINAQITGESIIQSNNVITPITAKAIKLHIGRLKASPWTPKDIEAIEKDFKEYTEGKYTTPPKTKPPKPIKPFEQYFAPKYREVLPELCKLIFNANNSQKDYAIMVCLLHEKYLLTFERADLYKSWYNFIERSFSPKESFAAINNHFIDIDPAYVCNESDIRYKQLKKAFEKVLKDKNIK